MIKIKHILIALIISFSAITFLSASNLYAAEAQRPDYNQQQKELADKKNQSCGSTKELKDKWSEKCYSCMVVAQVIDTFMNGAAKLYPIASEAGTKLLIFGFIIWAGFWGLKNLASMAGANGGQMMWEFLIMLFKIGSAYIAINIGIGILVGYFITPILDAGADYANTLLEQNSVLKDENGDLIKIELTEEEKIKTQDSVISVDTLNKILLVSKTASSQIATVMVIGSALNCYAWTNPLFEAPWYIPVDIRVENFIMIILGMIIWFVGFMLTMSICFYLLDLSFKLGFAVLLLPIAIGLWPFPLKDAKNKIGNVLGIVINAAGLFVMIAITVSLAIILLDNAFQTPNTTSQSGGITALFEKFEEDDKEYIANLFDISEPYVFIMLFCLVAGFKIVGKSDDYANKLFSSELSGLSPMHHATTAMVGKATSPFIKAGKAIGDIAAHQTGKALAKGAGAVGKGIGNTVRATNNRFVAPTVQAAKQGFKEGFVSGAKEGYKAGNAVAQNIASSGSPLQQKSAAEQITRNVAGVALGAASGATKAVIKGTLKGIAGGATGWFNNEKKHFKNMSARVVQSSKELGNNVVSTSLAVQRGDMQQAFTSAAKSATGVIKLGASFTRPTAKAMDNLSKVIAGDPQKAATKKAQKATQTRKTISQKAQENFEKHSQKHEENKWRGGVVGKVKQMKYWAQKGADHIIAHNVGFIDDQIAKKDKAAKSIDDVVENITDTFAQKIDKTRKAAAKPFSFDDENGNSFVDNPELQRLENQVAEFKKELEELKTKNASQKEIAAGRVVVQQAIKELNEHKELLEKTDLNQYKKDKDQQGNNNA